MNKININKEIVLMRQVVRQSRAKVVRKLIKESKLLRARKHGGPKTLEKCHRKAERLLAEIEAMKGIKDDEITKYGICETRDSCEILGDAVAEPRVRALARLASNKILHDKIVKFKEKFPDYEEHLGSGKRKLSKLQKKSRWETKNPMAEISEAMDEESSADEAEEATEMNEDEEFDNADNVDAEEDEKDRESDETDEGPSDIESSRDGSDNIIETNEFEFEGRENVEKRENLTKSKIEDRDVTTKPKKIKKLREKVEELIEMKKPVPIRVVSEEATVERFEDLLENATKSVESLPTKVKNEKRKMVHEPAKNIEKMADSFFMTANGESEYMSVVVPRQHDVEDDELWKIGRTTSFNETEDRGFEAKKSFRERNNKFFNKIDRDRVTNRVDSDGDKYQRAKGRSVGGAMRDRKFTPENARKRKNDEPKTEKKNGAAVEQELHPSWLAKKKQQEIIKQGFQGKKIVFDD